MRYSPNKNRCTTFTAIVSMQEDIRICKEAKEHVTSSNRGPGVGKFLDDNKEFMLTC